MIADIFSQELTLWPPCYHPSCRFQPEYLLQAHTSSERLAWFLSRPILLHSSPPRPGKPWTAHQNIRVRLQRTTNMFMVRRTKMSLGSYKVVVVNVEIVKSNNLKYTNKVLQSSDK